MTRLTLSAWLALAVALAACGRYGPPVRSEPSQPAPASGAVDGGAEPDEEEAE